MAPKNTAPTTDTDVSDAAAAARAEIANRPRQSVKRLVEYFAIIKDAAPERIEELFGDQADVLEANLGKVTNPIQAAIDKAVNAQVELATKALTNDDPLNGYKNFAFDQAAFDEKTKERKPRVVKDKVAKVKDIAANASPEELEQLRAMLAELDAS